MKFQGALITEQRITFAIVIVKYHILNSPSERDKSIQLFQPFFPGVPLILMAQDARKRPHYYGRKDIVKFLSKVPMEAIPWKEYTVS